MTDQVDSVSLVTDDVGNSISAIDYLPYGETWYQQGDTGFSPKYNSQELDKESGLYFFNARHYDPETARFETADSVVDGEYDAVGWNRYTYAHGNPIRYKDPTGHEGESMTLKSPTIEIGSDGSIGNANSESSVSGAINERIVNMNHASALEKQSQMSGKEWDENAKSLVEDAILSIKPEQRKIINTPDGRYSKSFTIISNAPTIIRTRLTNHARFNAVRQQAAHFFRTLA